MDKEVKKYIITIFTICRLSSSCCGLGIHGLARSCTELIIGIKMLHIPHTDPASDPDPSIINKNSKKNRDSYPVL
jgi:hypothetical protein